MNSNWKERTELLIGNKASTKLQSSHVFVAGLGGVGGYASEQLCRAGVGRMTIADADTIAQTNINRQIIAFQSSVGRDKSEVVKERLLDINPDLKITALNEFLRDERLNDFLKEPFDFVIDAIDTLAPKVSLIYNCIQNGLKLVSSMGSGGKIDPACIRVDDISKSRNCNLARMVRKRLHKLGVYSGFKVVYSPEETIVSVIQPIANEQNKKNTVGTISYMPAMFGCYCAWVTIDSIINS